MKTIILRTGVAVPRSFYLTTYRSLKWLKDYNPIALYELFQLVRNPNHELFGKYGPDSVGENLQTLKLVSPYFFKVHDMTKAIVLACVECAGFEVRLTDGLT